MMDPQYAHEYLAREQYITKELKRLQRLTQADRAYVVIYNSAFSSSGTGVGRHISNSFEVTGEEILPKSDAFQGTSRHLWLQLKQNERSKNGLFTHRPKSYGRELYDEHKMAIG